MAPTRQERPDTGDPSALSSIQRSYAVPITICVLLVIGGTIFLFLHIIDQADESLSAIKKLKVSYHDSGGQWKPDQDECARLVLRDLEKNPNCTEARYPNLPMSESALRALGQMHHLNQLDLGGTILQSDWLVNLEKLPLTSLSLYSSNLNDTGLKHITQIKSLIDLNLGDTEITDEGLKLLPDLPNLNALILAETELTADGVKSLKNIKTLTTLHYGTNPLKPPVVEALTSLTNLTSLDLSHNIVTSEMIDKLAALKKLDRLILTDCALHDAQVVQILKRFPNVNVLKIGSNPVTDASLKAMETRKHWLKVDFVNCSQLSDGAVNRFRAKYPDCEVVRTAALPPPPRLEAR